MIDLSVSEVFCCCDSRTHQHNCRGRQGCPRSQSTDGGSNPGRGEAGHHGGRVWGGSSSHGDQGAETPLSRDKERPQATAPGPPPPHTPPASRGHQGTPQGAIHCQSFGLTPPHSSSGPSCVTSHGGSGDTHSQTCL
ncbi:Hypothetical predicted protein [Marmota monax]|uniref:Uncharacterized protein n=1 Tax=Marmota monax TaxID=9995 RepID=A0A5E4D6I3_MARMO|nr:hypothetical protein GHT09_005229 [Marmota monax]VTJ89775.1 Hypothetical predicted protein [Marmota monax]